MANIEVAYATPEKQWIIDVIFKSGMTILEAIQQSQILTLCPEIDLNINKAGIFGEILSLDTLVKENDRVEIYRPLKQDPMAQRFERVKKERKRTS